MRLILVFVMLLGSVSMAESSRVLVMASGQCSDPLLSKSLEQMHGALTRQYGTQVLSRGEWRRAFGAASEYSLEEVRRNFRAAQATFDAARYEEAETQVRGVVAQLDTLVPSPELTQLSLDVSTLRALIYRGQGRTEAFDLMLRRLLYLQPSYQLSATETAPSVRAHFEALRERVNGLERLPLKVQSTPEGAEVFIDGRSMGLTPLMVQLPAASYRLVLLHRGRTSFVRELNVRSPTRLDIDLEFETLLDPRKSPCLNLESRKASFEPALKLASHVGAGSVVVLRLQRNEVGPDWLEATLLHVPDGRKVREGGIKLLQEEQMSSPVADLAAFIRTGVSAASVQSRPLDKSVFARSPWHRFGSVVTGVAGVVALGYAIDGTVRSSQYWSQYQALRANTLYAGSPEATQASQVAALGRKHGTEATWLYVSGGAALVGSVLWWAFDHPDAPGFSAWMTPDAAFGTLSFTLP